MELPVTTAAQSGWLGIDGGDWLAAITNALAIIMAILIAARIAPKVEERRARRDQQERLLRILISTSSTPANPEYQGAIGLIPIDFKGNKRVLDTRAEYLALVNAPAPEDDREALDAHHRQTVDKQYDLIEAIAQSLDFDLTSEALRTGEYISRGFVEREQLLLVAMSSWPRIANALELNNRMFAASLGLQPDQQQEQPPVEKTEGKGGDED